MASCEKPKISYDGCDAVFEMGEHTLRIPMSLHQKNRERLCARLKSAKIPPRGMVVLQGGEDHHVGSSDAPNVFRQEAYFHWAFGVLEPGWFGAIEVDTGASLLFCPRLPESYAMWLGRIISLGEYRDRYQVDRVYYVEQIADVLRERNPGSLFTLHGTDSDSGIDTLEAAFEGISQFTVNNSFIHDHIAECRVIKTDEEIRILRYAAEVSSAAHRDVMKKIRPGMKEYQLESLFRHYSYYHGGCRHQAYTSICGSGCNAATLHYGCAGLSPNLRTVEDGDMCLFDMGAEYYCYASDITCSFPANGKFTDDQKTIYNAVLAASRAVIQAARPGVSWVDMHTLSYETMLAKLKEAGILVGDVQDMMKAKLGAVFQPHGLGHLIGISVHDVGGYLESCPPRPDEPGHRNLRMARILEENMALTIEPGCYFIDYILDGALSDPVQSRFFNREVLDRFRGMGGVRIEDDVIITPDGIDNLTQVPRTVEEIEALMAEGQKEEVFVPQLQLQKKLQK